MIDDISELNVRGDINIAGTNDVFLRCKYGHILQDSKIMKNETGSVAFREPIILENAEPTIKQMLIIEVWDADTVTNDDLLGICEFKVPDVFAREIGETQCDIKSPNGDKVIGKLRISQIHFIKQKLRMYRGPCKPCCCCLETGVDSKEIQYRGLNSENKDGYQAMD